VSFADKLANKAAENVAKHNEIAAKTNAVLLSKYDENRGQKNNCTKIRWIFRSSFPVLEKLFEVVICRK
jgi:hypothetical protein